MCVCAYVCACICVCVHMCVRAYVRVNGVWMTEITSHTVHTGEMDRVGVVNTQTKTQFEKQQ